MIDIDIYAYFKIEYESSETDIKRAYKSKAKELHPDKNKDNPKAISEELFQELQDIYEVFLDPTKKAAYDRQWVAKREAKKRLDEMDEGRRRLKEELERKEAVAAKHRTERSQFMAKEKVADQLRRQFIHEQEQREYNARQERKLLEEAHQMAEMEAKFSNHATVKLSWRYKDVSVFDEYNKQLLTNSLKVYGKVLNLVIGKKGTAIAEMESANDAAKMYEESKREEVGLASNPLKVSWLSGKPPDLNVEAPILKETQATTVSSDVSQPKTDFESFENDILSKMAKFS